MSSEASLAYAHSEESDLHTWNSHNGGVYREDEKIHYSDRKEYEQILFAGLHVW